MKCEQCASKQPDDICSKHSDTEVKEHCVEGPCPDEMIAANELNGFMTIDNFSIKTGEALITAENMLPPEYSPKTNADKIRALYSNDSVLAQSRIYHNGAYWQSKDIDGGVWSNLTDALTAEHDWLQQEAEQ